MTGDGYPDAAADAFAEAFALHQRLHSIARIPDLHAPECHAAVPVPDPFGWPGGTEWRAYCGLARRHAGRHAAE